MKWVGLVLCLVGLAASGPPVSRSKDEIIRFKEALERSRIDDGVLLESRMLQNPLAGPWENSGKYQGDIVLDPAQVEALVHDYATNNKEDTSRNAYIVANTKWPGNIMHWVFGANQFTSAQQNQILNGMSWIEHFSCVRFRRRTNERVFVTITGRPTGCYAHVGFSTQWPNRVNNLAVRGCLHHTIIIHELLHNLGFQHMHQTFGRNSFIRVNLQNVLPDYRFAFSEFRSNQVSLLSLPYEYTSNMHYGPFAFSSNRQATITALRSFSGTMGQREQVTATDWLRLRRHYNCPGAWRSGELERIESEVQRTLPLMKMNLAAPKKGLYTDEDNAYVRSLAAQVQSSDGSVNNEEVMDNEYNPINESDDFNEGVAVVDGEDEN